MIIGYAIVISSDWGKVNAELVDNKASRSLVQMLPLTIEMRDHLRQEKPATCLHRCPRSSGNSISRPGHWDSGTQITLSSTTAADACLSRGSFCSGE
jgi:hypothetical protein